MLSMLETRKKKEHIVKKIYIKKRDQKSKICFRRRLFLLTEENRQAPNKSQVESSYLNRQSL